MSSIPAFVVSAEEDEAPPLLASSTESLMSNADTGSAEPAEQNRAERSATHDYPEEKALN